MPYCGTGGLSHHPVRRLEACTTILAVVCTECNPELCTSIAALSPQAAVKLIGKIQLETQAQPLRALGWES